MTRGGADGPAARVTVVIVDDHAILRSGVERLLADTGHIAVVGDADGVESGLQVIERTSPDIVLLDLDMPGIGGIDGCRRMLARRPDLGIVILSMHDDPVMARQAFAAGARGYVVKTAADDELIAAIAAVAAGGRFVNATMGAVLAAGSDTSPIDVLTSRELDVLRLLALGHTNQEIAGRLFLSARTVESHRAHIMRKLGVSTRAQLVRIALDARVLDLARRAPASPDAEGG